MATGQEKEYVLAKWTSIDRISGEIARDANKILSSSKKTNDNDKKRFLQGIELSAKNTLIDMYISTYEQETIDEMMEENPEQFLNAMAENARIISIGEPKIKTLGVMPTATSNKQVQ